jgi:hypothetical protein
MSCALSETMTVAGMHDGIIRLWRTEDVFAGVLTGMLTGSQYTVLHILHAPM